MQNRFFVFFHAKIQSLVLETQHLRIIVWILDPPGMPGVRNLTFTNYFWDLGPTWDVWCQKPNIYELFFGFCSHLGCLVSETKHLRINFGIWDPPGMFGVRNPTFTNYFWDLVPIPGMFGVGNPTFTIFWGGFGPTWDVWYQKPNIYELLLGFCFKNVSSAFPKCFPSPRYR